MKTEKPTRYEPLREAFLLSHVCSGVLVELNIDPNVLLNDKTLVTYPLVNGEG